MAQAFLENEVAGAGEELYRSLSVHQERGLALVDAAGDYITLEGTSVLAGLGIGGERDMHPLIFEHVRAAIDNRRSHSFELLDSKNQTFFIQVQALSTTDMVAIIVDDLTAVKSAQMQLVKLANTDDLTGLPNRSWVFSRLEKACTHPHSSALLLLDIDGFKSVNDLLGHEHGDILLCEIANHLLSILRSSDAVARLGGDEFVVILSSVTPSEVGEVARRILRVLHEPIHIQGEQIYSAASVGITFIRPQSHPSEILREADLAMYAAKNNGGNTMHFFEAGLAVAASERQALAADLHRALSRQEFTLSYQPQFDVENGNLVSAEALLRWQRAGTTIGPEGFIDVAERSGLIVALGEYVLLEACENACRWQKPGVAVRLAVNVSPVQLRQKGFENVVAGALAATGLPAHLLELEITETALSSEKQTLATLAALSNLGVHLVVDDFGTGYSSLSRLKQFPVNIVKIDRAFVSGLGVSADDEALVSAIITLAKALGLTVLAEGVERAEQLDFLRAHGCDLCSGWLFTAALDAEAMLALCGV